MNHLRSGMESLLANQGLDNLMQSKGTYRDSNGSPSAYDELSTGMSAGQNMTHPGGEQSPYEAFQKEYPQLSSGQSWGNALVNTVLGGSTPSPEMMRGEVDLRQEEPGIEPAFMGMDTLTGYAFPRVSAAYGNQVLKNAPQIAERMNRMFSGELVGMKPQLNMTAYHGSPHKFDKFSMENIGTGEGAQAYGHGLYFAENKGVAQNYRDAVPAADVRRNFLNNLPEDAEFEDVMSMIGKGEFTDNQESVLRALEADDWLGFDYPSQAISAAYKQLDNFDPSPQLRKAIDNTGSMYEVDIPDKEIVNFLDWDAPLSEQPESVRKAMIKIAEENPDYFGGVANGLKKGYDSNAYAKYKGADFYGALMDAKFKKITTSGETYQNSPLQANKGTMKLASDHLNSLGIKGIKYFDGSSRAAGEGTRNLVVFDDKIIKTLKRNDEALPTFDNLMKEEPR